MLNHFTHLRGEMNPARCALVFLRNGDIPIDEKSFEEVIKETPPYNGTDGFMVETANDLQRLCEIGHFSIVEVGGLLTARKD